MATYYPEDLEYQESIGSKYLLDNLKEKNMKNINWHHYRTLAFWACVVVIGILTSLQGQGVGDFTILVGIIGGFEHMLAGKTS